MRVLLFSGWIVSIFFVICASALALTTGQDKDGQALRERFQAWAKSHQHGYVNWTAGDLQRVKDLWAKHGPNYGDYHKTEIAYPCGALAKSPSVPTSVHRLRPGDVKIIGAMGDSYSAGTGIAATTILTDLIQYRGLAWSGGGQTDYEDQITVPNILKKYNPELYGYATDNGDEDSRHSFFNVAVSGSYSSDLPNQARKLVDRMKADPKVDMVNDWKVVTILSGNNDLCDYCKDRDLWSVERFRTNTMAALDILQAELPRTLVNLIEPINVEMIRDINKGMLCSFLHGYLCECMAFPKSPEKFVEAALEVDRYQVTVEDIVRSGRYDTREDFAVVYQPFTNNSYFITQEDGQPDMSFFAPDCFHLSLKGQAAAATALWNNMVEPAGKKTVEWSPGDPIKCPTEDQPYFFTSKNSDLAAAHESPQHQGGHKAASIAAVVVVCVVIIAAVVIVIIRWRLRRHSYIAV